ncbi:MAG: hypothetical protein A2168_00855 [Planctomycetes bacterium RBG_13_50_24]|nr:MAG: hypothetical protein A2168_00855 [Planctomycetes bacterium RBG_13_50_24]
MAAAEEGIFSLQEPADRVTANASMARGFIKDMSDLIVTSQGRPTDNTLISAVRKPSAAG